MVYDKQLYYQSHTPQAYGNTKHVPLYFASVLMVLASNITAKMTLIILSKHYSNFTKYQDHTTVH